MRVGGGHYEGRGRVGTTTGGRVRVQAITLGGRLKATTGGTEAGNRYREGKGTITWGVRLKATTGGTEVGNCYREGEETISWGVRLKATTGGGE